MSLHQKIFAIIVAVALLLFILDLVRRRKMKEEYSWLWLLAGVALVVLVGWYDSLIFISGFIGAENPLTTLFIFGFLFLVFVNIDYSMQISKQKEQIKKIAQRLALLSQEEEDLGEKKK